MCKFCVSSLPCVGLLLILVFFSGGCAGEHTSAEPAPKTEEKPIREMVTDSAGIKLVLIPAGKFTMGGGRPKDEEIAFLKKYEIDWGNIPLFIDDPNHEVQITKKFWMGVHHVTRGQFAKFVTDTGYKTDAEKPAENALAIIQDPLHKHSKELGSYGANDEKNVFWDFQPNASWRNAGFPQGDDHPVVHISWNDAKAFCAWLSKKEGETYRLPTEAEWEYACRAGTTTRFWCGDDPESLFKVANTADAELKKKFPKLKIKVTASDGFVYTSPVGSFEANPFGLYDMHGNACQWCEDKRRTYDNNPQIDPVGAGNGKMRSMRGGSWRVLWAECGSARRTGAGSPSTHGDDFSFRVVRDYREAPKRVNDASPK